MDPSINGPMTPSLGPMVVLLAPIAVATAAWFGHVVLRGTRVSEMRQKWIDEQRADLALVVSRAYILVELGKEGPTSNGARVDALGDLEAAAFRIKLRENPVKPEWSDVIRRVDLIRDFVRSPGPPGTSLSSLSGGIIPTARSRLKTEWNLVRDGEDSYRKASRHYWFWFWALAVLAGIVLATSR